MIFTRNIQKVEVKLSKMATPSKRGKYLYESNDLVDDFLFNVVIKHVNIDKISDFTRHFEIELIADPLTQEALVSEFLIYLVTECFR